MLVRRSLLLGFSMASAVFGLVLSRDVWAQDVRHLCSEKYQAAKAAGTLNGEAWPQFYRKCTAETKANPPPGNRDVISQVERLSSMETNIAPRSLRIAFGASGR